MYCQSKHASFRSIILKATGASDYVEKEVIQSLWSGYGKILRLELIGAKCSTVVVKHVHLPEQSKHPRGWNTARSHQRKLKSYEVEMAWYASWSQQCDEYTRVPHCLALEAIDNEVLMILEDLDAAGFANRRSSASKEEIGSCLKWLAHFHATFINCPPQGLWKTGTYWHLETRPDELEALQDLKLKAAAESIDKALKSSPFQTLVHGDAKLANFCFPNNGSEVATVDFQYVGGGCGMKDVAYFIGSCLDENECEQQEAALLDVYFDALEAALSMKKKAIDFKALKKDWEALYPIAWTDFHRFLKGWSPGHWKIHSYSERLAQEVISTFNQSPL